MATGTMLSFDHLALLIANGTVDFVSDTIKVALVDAIPAASATTWASISSTASANVGVPKTLASKTVTQVATDDAMFDGADVVFTASGGASTVAGFVIYDDTVTSPADALLWYGDTDTGEATITLNDGESLTLQFNANGIARLVDAA